MYPSNTSCSNKLCRACGSSTIDNKSIEIFDIKQKIEILLNNLSSNEHLPQGICKCREKLKSLEGIAQTIKKISKQLLREHITDYKRHVDNSQQEQTQNFEERVCWVPVKESPVATVLVKAIACSTNKSKSQPQVPLAICDCRETMVKTSEFSINNENEVSRLKTLTPRQNFSKKIITLKEKSDVAVADQQPSATRSIKFNNDCNMNKPYVQNYFNGDDITSSVVDPDMQTDAMTDLDLNTNYYDNNSSSYACCACCQVKNTKKNSPCRKNNKRKKVNWSISPKDTKKKFSGKNMAQKTGSVSMSSCMKSPNVKSGQRWKSKMPPNTTETKRKKTRSQSQVYLAQKERVKQRQKLAALQKQEQEREDQQYRDFVTLNSPPTWKF